MERRLRPDLRRAFLRGAVLLLLAPAGCWVPLERGRQMEARLQKLEVDSVEQRRRIDEQREVVRERVAKIDQKIDELNRAARRSGADLSVNVSKLQDDLAKARGDLEVEQHRLDEMDKAVGALRSDTDARFAALKGAGALDEYTARQKASELQKPDDKAAFFALAQKEDTSGDKGVARELYLQYVKRWPTDPKSAEAGFRAGDILSGQKRWREALLAYGKVAEDFPKSDRAPDALLQTAESMLRLDMKDDARGILEQVVQRYPKTPAASRAKQRLAELFPPPPPEKHSKAKKR